MGVEGRGLVGWLVGWLVDPQGVVESRREKEGMGGRGTEEEEEEEKWSRFSYSIHAAAATDSRGGQSVLDDD